MSIELPSGAIQSDQYFVNGALARSRSEASFRVGKVVAVYYPDDEASYSKKFIEYDVLADTVDENGMYTKVMYSRAKVLSLFGGAADFMDFTYRLSTVSANGQPSSTNGPNSNVDYGSDVALLCINKDVRQAWIIGGLKHQALSDNPNYTPTLEAGTHLNAEFNGMVFQINDAGELIVTFNGKTQDDGTLDDSADSANSGSNLTMSKDGSISITSPSGNQTIVQDNTNDQTTITADSQMNLNSSGNVVIKSTGVLTGNATDNTLLGTSFRTAQSTMDSEIVTLSSSISSLMTSFGAQLSAAATALATPITGGTIASPILASASISALTLGTLFAQWSAAVQTFEVGSQSDYLSLVNKSD